MKKRCSHCGKMLQEDMFDKDYVRGGRRIAACRPCRKHAKHQGRTMWCCKTWQETSAHRSRQVRIPGQIFESMGEPTHIVWKLHDDGSVEMECKYGEDSE